MRKYFIFGLLILILALPLGASAQGETVIESVQVELWPEFDRSAMLVIYRIELSPETPLPAPLRFSIPAAAGEPTAVAFREGDRLLMSEYSVTQAGEFLVVDFLCESSTCQFEYYDPSLSLDGSMRTFDYTWPGDAAVNHLTIKVQQPFDVSEMVLEPGLDAGEAGFDGLIYYARDFGAFEAGEEFEFALQYDKPSNTLTVSFLESQLPAQQPAADPQDGGGAGVSGFALDWRWLAALLALVMIGVGIYGYISSQRRRPSRKGSGPRPRRSAGAGAGVFCHQCGAQAAKGDKFCRECGAKLRV